MIGFDWFLFVALVVLLLIFGAACYALGYVVGKK
jgi:hypothetical protein